MQPQAQTWPRQQQTHRKIDVKSYLRDSDNGKDDQARSLPVVIDITSDQETTIDPQPSTSNFSASTPLRRPNTYLKVLSLGRGTGNSPLADWTSVAKGHGHRFISRCDLPQAPPVQQELVERNLAIVAPTDRVQTYEGDIDIAPSTSRKDLANWSWVRRSNTRARLTNHNKNRLEQRQQRPNDNINDRTSD